VATCAMAVDMLDGSMIILIMHEALYFGTVMDHLLINPNQIRITRIPVNDDLFDQSRPFGIDHLHTILNGRSDGTLTLDH
jgi:hypothetical protein